MAPGARSKFVGPVFEPELFRKQVYWIEGSTCDIVGIFWRPGNCSPFDSPSLRPCIMQRKNNWSLHSKLPVGGLSTEASGELWLFSFMTCNSSSSLRLSAVLPTTVEESCFSSKLHCGSLSDTVSNTRSLLRLEVVLKQLKLFWDTYTSI